MLWNAVMEPVWRQRCEPQHGKENRAESEENVKVAERIPWYVTNRHNVLSAYNSRLARFYILTIHRMSRDRKS
jgi:hypothetical protein